MFTLLLSFAIASILAVVLHGSTRKFVRNRLRYVDAIQKSLAPWVAGGGAFLLGTLCVGFLPLVGLGTALTAGLAVGSGVAAGARDIRQGVSPIVYGP
jgi:predicted lysophospholipase L1 biosynthesis ABC-type transport system permease subunit